MQRLPEEPVEQRARRARLVGGAHLAEDLALARHHRVEPGCDPEEVERRSLVAQPVEHRPQLVLGQPGNLRQRLDAAPLRVSADEVELRAVAGREADRLAVLAGELARQLACLRAGQRDPLPQLDGGDVVRQADEDQSHEKWVRGRPSRTTITSAKPASRT